MGKLSVKKGIERLAKVYCWPNDPSITDKDKYEFNALCEFVVFKEFIMDPFFRSLSHYSYKHIAKLYQHLSSLPMDKTHMLTYKEAYLFMRYLYFTGNDIVKSILEQISCPSNIYNGIIRSLEEENYNLFFSALEKSDFTMMMQVLWLMRYILLGEKGSWNNINPSIPHLTLLPFLPRWVKIVDDYRPYFEVHDDDDEGKFIDERVIEIVHGRLRKKRRLKRNPSPTNDHNDNFEEDNRKELERLLEESLFKSQWKDLLAEFADNSDLPVINSRVNRSYIEDLARLILTHNVILHKDYIMEKYDVDSSEIYNQFRNTDIYTYESGNSKDLGRYILYYISEMQNVYKIVKDFLPEQKRQSILHLLDRYPKRNNESDGIAEIHTTIHNQGEKLFVAVLNSKLKGITCKEKNSELLKCLSLLYEELTNEGNNLIDTVTPKALFIYRFSGKGEEFPLKTKIKWRGKNVLLGHIIRCLLSDKKYAPEDMGIVSDFFESKSGKPINLATARQVDVIDYETQKDSLNKNFVKAVDLLQHCGFINVEYTSKRR